MAAETTNSSQLKFTQFTVDQARIAVFWCHSDGKFFYINKTACEWLGYSEDELKQMHVADINPEFPREAWPAHWNEIKKKGLVKIESVHQRKSGEVYPVEIYSNYVEFEGEEFKLAFVHDITERKKAEQKIKESAAMLKESEARFRTFTENAPDFVMQVDYFGIIQFINRTLEGTTREEVQGTSVYSWIPDEYLEKFKKGISRVFETAESVVVEHPAIDTKGESRWYSTHMGPIGDHGNVTSAILSARDITQAKILEEQLRQSEKMQAIGQLAGGVAHDFNNQLATIINFAELAKEEAPEDSNINLYINNIISGALHSADLTKKLLAYARKGRYLITTIDVNKSISDVISILSHSIDKKIRISRQLNANPAHVSGDMSQVQNALLNIALNSRDAMPDGGELVFSTEVVEFDAPYITEHNYDVEPGEYLHIHVSDNGLGMDAETRKHIYEPFFTTKEVGKGTGMGMASVYGTVKSHKGVIDVESRPGTGTSTHIYLPVVRGKAPEPPSQPEVTKSHTASILIVDDEEMLAQSLKLMLVSEGYPASACKSGKEALKIYRESWQNIDLVILDLSMPDMDGRETFLAMKEINPGINCILLSGYSITEGAEEIIKKGARGFIQKPVVKEDFLNYLTEFLKVPADKKSR